MAAMSLALEKICLYIMRKMRLIHKGLPWYIEKFPDVYWREISMRSGCSSYFTGYSF